MQFREDIAFVNCSPWLHISCLQLYQYYTLATSGGSGVLVDPASLPVTALRALLWQRGVHNADVFEKAEFVRLTTLSGAVTVVCRVYVYVTGRTNAIDIKTAVSEYVQVETELDNTDLLVPTTNSPYQHTLHFTHFAHFNELVRTHHPLVHWLLPQSNYRLRTRPSVRGWCMWSTCAAHRQSTPHTGAHSFVRSSRSAYVSASTIVDMITGAWRGGAYMYFSGVI